MTVGTCFETQIEPKEAPAAADGTAIAGASLSPHLQKLAAVKTGHGAANANTGMSKAGTPPQHRVARTGGDNSAGPRKNLMKDYGAGDTTDEADWLIGTPGPIPDTRGVRRYTLKLMVSLVISTIICKADLLGDKDAACTKIIMWLFTNQLINTCSKLAFLRSLRDQWLGTMVCPSTTMTGGWSYPIYFKPKSRLGLSCSRPDCSCLNNVNRANIVEFILHHSGCDSSIIDELNIPMPQLTRWPRKSLCFLVTDASRMDSMIAAANVDPNIGGASGSGAGGSGATSSGVASSGGGGSMGGAGNSGGTPVSIASLTAATSAMVSISLDDNNKTAGSPTTDCWYGEPLAFSFRDAGAAQLEDDGMDEDGGGEYEGDDVWPEGDEDVGGDGWPEGDEEEYAEEAQVGYEEECDDGWGEGHEDEGADAWPEGVGEEGVGEEGADVRQEGDEDVDADGSLEGDEKVYYVEAQEE
ncbi:hypothetical protein GPECTOR_118g383 [Gonium pectorale]|uniref:Uncharacterized protein n=1 Tax=Gonium pectorale TaxID=33097 RepID=A0A150FYT9_GONPE|nr:hypothetical protein GPECTOR_118g383 [Gonium pectorale]|eukprot:KXZ42786.1 hypothetical protein GPECTOR_118g383 [Gonium pectorale]